MLKRLLLLGAISLALPVGAMAQGSPGSGDPPGGGRGGGRAPGTKRQEKMTESQRVLYKHIDAVDWDDMPLEEIFDWLKAQGDVNVIVRWDPLAQEGIDPGTPVTLKMRDTTVAKILTEVFDQIAESDPILYRGIDNIIKISTKADFSRKLYVKVYDINDIVFQPPDFTGAPNVDLTRGQSGGGGGGGGDETIWADDDDDDDGDDKAELDQRIENLIQLIRSTVEPESWRGQGGEGTIVAFNRTLVVRNTIEVHTQIGGPFVIE